MKQILLLRLSILYLMLFFTQGFASEIIDESSYICGTEKNPRTATPKTLDGSAISFLVSLGKRAEQSGDIFLSLKDDTYYKLQSGGHNDYFYSGKILRLGLFMNKNFQEGTLYINDDKFKVYCEHQIFISPFN